MATPGVIGQRHYGLAQDIRRTLAQYAQLKDIIAMLGLEQLSTEDRSVVARARRLERFLTQPFFTTEQFTGLEGKLVSLEHALDGCERILRDEFKDHPESALYMVGTVDEAHEKAKFVGSGAKGAPGPEPRTEAPTDANGRCETQAQVRDATEARSQASAEG
jgi:F-type H+-transporting ATPase subunit beta